MNGSRLIAGCFRFIFGSRYAESTCSNFGVSAYSRLNMVIETFFAEVITGIFFLHHVFCKTSKKVVSYSRVFTVFVTTMYFLNVDIIVLKMG